MKEITEDYVSFETRKLLLKKGMPEDLFNHIIYDKGDGGNVRKYYSCSLNIAMKWLRDVHNFHITAFPAWDNDDGTKMSFEKWGESIDGLDGEYCMPISGPVYYNSYEQACEAAIEYVLENLI